jgi:hypothetical protein
LSNADSLHAGAALEHPGGHVDHVRGIRCCNA